jgi:3-deoxy-D-manno-octulosonate 8-phosphate phosphatase (KDO 8-P phosphatase)
MNELGFEPHKIKLVVLDADGTLTDAGIYLTAAGEEIKKFNARDGLAMNRLNKNGLRVAILSHSKNVDIIRKRAEMLGLQTWYAGQEKKSVILARWAEEFNLKPENILYLGDDLNDLDAFQYVDVGVCPVDADPLIKKHARLILQSKGGDACFRELADRAFRDLLLFEP